MDATSAQVSALKAAGSMPVCYFNAGASEKWRSDDGAIPAQVRGKAMSGWPGEHWLDTRQLDVLRPVMAARMDQCRDKGFVAVDPDNVDGYDNETGFDLTREESSAYLRMLAQLAHERGLSIGLKNSIDLLPTVGPVVDFAVNEQCQEMEECEGYDAFTATGKPVLNVEYEGSTDRVCAGQRTGFTTVLAKLDLDGAVKMCA